MSVIVAKIFALYFMGIGIAILANPSAFRESYKDMLKNRGVLLLGGVIAILFGAFVVSIHNIWYKDWRVLLTIFGWWSLIKGILLIGYPQFVEYFKPLFTKDDQFYRGLGGVLLLVGILFAYGVWG